MDDILAAIDKLLLRGDSRTDGFDHVLLLHFIYLEHGPNTASFVVGRLALIDYSVVVGANEAYEISATQTGP